MNSTNLYVEKLHEDSMLPERATTYSAAYDVRAYISSPWEESIKSETLKPSGRTLVPTGIKVSAPLGYQVDVLSRSGMPFKTGLIVGNGVGLIDPDYRGELFILLINTSDETVTINHGDKIAQIQVQKIIEIDIVEGELPPVQSDRVGGFGSTGK